MTDPASVVRRELDALTQTQGSALQEPKPVTEFELADFGVRAKKIRALSQALDLSNSLPGEPVRKPKIAYPYSSV